MIIENPLNEFSLAFPILECVHILGFVGGIGTSALVSFHLLGVGLTQRSAARLWSDTMPWTLSGLALAIFSGLLLFSIDPEMYYSNLVFLWKLGALALAVLFYYTVVRRSVRSGSSGTWARIVACVSLGLWASVLFGGIFIGFFTAKVNLG